MTNVKYNTKAVVTIPAWAEQMHSGTEGQIDTISSPPAAFAWRMAGGSRVSLQIRPTATS